MPFVFTPAKAGLMGAVLAFLFLVIFVVLGFYQPGYNHLSNTISVLVLGKMGWIQTVNFFILALAFICIGFGFGKSLTQRNFNEIFVIFLAFAVFTVLIALVPTEKATAQEIIQIHSLSSTGKIHYIFLFCLILLIPMLLLPVVRRMRQHPKWRSLVPHTLGILTFDFIVGLLWYYLVSLGYLNEWKGLIQKVLATNVLGWLITLGYRLWVD